LNRPNFHIFDFELKKTLNLSSVSGLTDDAMELAAGRSTLDNLAWFPAILNIAFGLLYILPG